MMFYLKINENEILSSAGMWMEWENIIFNDNSQPMSAVFLSYM
jgi:hypothetical protein